MIGKYSMDWKLIICRLVSELAECMWKGTKPLASGEEGFLSGEI